jgi:TonB family protein
MMNEAPPNDVQPSRVNDVGFAPRSIARNPVDHRIRFRAFLLTFVLHVVVLLTLIRGLRPGVVHVGADMPRQQGIGAFVTPTPRPTGTTGTSTRTATKMPATTKVPVPEPRRNVQTSAAAEPESGNSPSAGSSGGQTGAGPTEPVRLGSGQQLGIIKRVEPIYPPTMHVARREGVVVLDAVIHRDGTIGDIKVLKATSPEFEQAAITAVKQWRYTPLPYEGIVTVTLNFTLPH